MIFRPELARAIQQRRKTQTRRPVKQGERCRYEEGKVYSVQPGRGKRAVCKVTITDVHEEWLGELDLLAAKREGFRTTAAFFAYWHALYGPADSAGVRDMERRLAELDPESEAARAFIASIEESRARRLKRPPLPAMPCRVYVISFVVGDARDVPRLLRASAPTAPTCKAPLRGPDGEIIYKDGQRYDEKGERKQVPVLCNRAFRDGQAVCECGARRPEETVEDHGYTTRSRLAMADEPEAVSAAEQEQLAKETREREAHRSLKPWRSRGQKIADEIAELKTELEEHPGDRQLYRDLARAQKAFERIAGRLAEAA